MKRAYDEAGRDERRSAILAAAEALLKDADGDLPSMASIASRAGLAKGTLYLYFRTKEEILAALLHQLWVPMLAAFEEAFTRADRPLEEQVTAFATRFGHYCEGRSYLLRLDAIAKEVIERNMSAAALAAHRAAAHASLGGTGKRLEDALSLPKGRGFQVLVRTHALIRGLWQSFGDPQADCLSHATHLFVKEVREATTEYLRGALAR